jgi:hypothetical protein
MLPIAALDESWRDQRARRLARYARAPALGRAGLELGPMTVIAKRIRDRWGGPDLALAGNEARILALLSVAHGRPVSPSVIGDLRRAAKAMARGDRALAAIHLAHTGLPRIAEDEETAFRLFAAEMLLDAGLCPRQLMEGLGLDPWPLAAIKYDPGEPRLPAGQTGGGEWTDGGAGVGANPNSMIVPADYVAPTDKRSDLSPEDGARIAGKAEAWAGTMYAPSNTLYAGPNAKQGTAADCSGSVWAIYGQAGLPYKYESSAAFASAAASLAIPFRQLDPSEAPQPGDVVVYASGHMSTVASIDSATGETMVWSAHRAGFRFGLFSVDYFQGAQTRFRYQNGGTEI